MQPTSRLSLVSVTRTVAAQGLLSVQVRVLGLPLFWFVVDDVDDYDG